MFHLILGFCLGFTSLILFGAFVFTNQIKKGKYASACWDDAKQQWVVRGQYLTIAGKIRMGVTRDDNTVKYIK